MGVRLENDHKCYRKAVVPCHNRPCHNISDIAKSTE